MADWSDIGWTEGSCNSSASGGFTKYGVNGCVMELPLTQYAFEPGAFVDGAFVAAGEILCPLV